MQDLALKYILLGEQNLKLFYYVAFVAGLIFSAVFMKVTFRIGRGSWILGVGLVALVTSLLQFFWLLAPDAIVNGWLAVLVMMDLAAGAAAGFVVTTLAKGRSNDGFGDSGSTYLAYIPFVGFWFSLKGSHDGATLKTSPKSRAIGVLKGIGGVVLFFLCGGLNVEAQRDVERALTAREDALGVIQRHQVANMGLGSLLTTIAANNSQSIRINDELLFEKATASPNALNFYYKTSYAGDTIPRSTMRSFMLYVCADATIQVALERTAVIRYHFSDERSGFKYAVETIDGSVCADQNAFAAPEASRKAPEEPEVSRKGLEGLMLSSPTIGELSVVRAE